MKRTVLIILLISLSAFGKTPRLNITLKHDSEGEQKRKTQIERLAQTFMECADLSAPFLFLQVDLH